MNEPFAKPVTQSYLIELKMSPDKKQLKYESGKTKGIAAADSQPNNRSFAETTKTDQNQTELNCQLQKKYRALQRPCLK